MINLSSREHSEIFVLNNDSSYQKMFGLGTQENQLFILVLDYQYNANLVTFVNIIKILCVKYIYCASCFRRT